MSTKYLLPCTCGTETVVEQRQAGELVTCTCGRELEVPTLRGLQQLQTSEITADARSSWGPKQGLAFIGILLTLASLGFAAYAYATRPKLDVTFVRDVMEATTPANSLLLWQVVRQGVDVGPTPMSTLHSRQLASSWRWVYIGLAAAAFGALLTVSSFLIEPSRR